MTADIPQALPDLAVLGSYFVVREVADRLGQTEPEVRALIVNGPLVAHRFGETLLVHRDDLVAFLRSRGAL